MVLKMNNPKKVGSILAWLTAFCAVFAIALCLTSASEKAWAAEAKITLNTKQPKLVSMTYDGEAYVSGSTIETGKKLTITVKTGQAQNNILLVNSVKVNNKAQAVNIDKAKWQTANSDYKRLMKENVNMVTFEKVLASSTTFSNISITGNTTINVDFQTLAPVYRLYNKISSEHLFTNDKGEYDKFAKLCKANKDYWIPEGIDWMSPVSGTPVYRLYNPGLGKLARSSHYYTTNATERANLKKKYGWKDDFKGKPAFYSGGSQAVYTVYNEALGSAHHYTSSFSEYKGLLQHGWDLEPSKSMKNGKWTGTFKCVMGTKTSSTAPVEDFSGDIILGSFTVSNADWSNQLYWSTDGLIFNNFATAFKDPLNGTHIYSKADGNAHYPLQCPSIMYYNGYFWMISNAGQNIENGKATFCISYSKNLKNWTTPWGFKCSIADTKGMLGTNQVAPEWFVDPDTKKVYIVQSMGYYADFHGDRYTNDKMKPYIVEVSNLKASDPYKNNKGMWIPSNLNPKFGTMKCMNSVVKAERGNSKDNLIDGCIYKEGKYYYLVIKNKGLTNDIFRTTNIMGDNWTKFKGKISWGYEAPSLIKLNNKYLCYVDGVDGTKPVGTKMVSSSSLGGKWSGAQTLLFMDKNGKQMTSRHGSCYVLKKGTAEWKAFRSAMGVK